MQLCLMIEGQEDVTWDDWVALADACEASGVEVLFRSDHYLSGDGQNGRGSHDAWTTLAAIAARTSRVRLGTMVSPVTFRHPSLVANAATTVDHISGGRVEFGLGAGWYELEHQTFGFPFPPMRDRMEMLEEQLEIVIAQWTQDEFSFDGRHYRLDRCQANPKPVQRPHPPVIVGGGGKPRTVDLAARFGQEYNVVSADPEECARIRGALDEATARHGRERLVFSFMETTLIGRDRDDLMEKADRLGRLHWDGISGEQLLAEHADGWVRGTVDEVATQLEELAGTGLERAMLQHLDHRDLETVRLIGEELQPRVAAL
ncbi:MAG TPA: TIGR03560 family F420-dependent LLM class oxidoreductase [Gaiellales bacterium]|nr:TIGR03560 family F420-dependent LLM class oxidoreductase [Gaiellales bacterium]